MSKIDLEMAFRLVENVFSQEEMDFCGTQSLVTLKNAEDTLNARFPGTYKRFLQTYGCGGVGSLEIYGLIKNETFSQGQAPTIGIPNVVWTNLEWQRDFNHPKHLVIINEIGEGSVYCLDTSQMNAEGECPVVVWPMGGYEATPKLEVVAEDFGKFFLDMVQRQIEYKEEA